MSTHESRNAHFHLRCTALQRWAASHEGKPVSATLVYSGLPLGQWILFQRRLRETGRLSSERASVLSQACPIWHVSERDWLFAYRVSQLHLWVERHDTADVPYNERTGDGFWIGRWVARQRALRTSMPQWRRQALSAVPGWTW